MDNIGFSPVRGIRVLFGPGPSYVFTTYEPDAAEKIMKELCDSGLLSGDTRTAMRLGSQIGKMDRILP